jgi:hypothetical protein
MQLPGVRYRIAGNEFAPVQGEPDLPLSILENVVNPESPHHGTCCDFPQSDGKFERFVSARSLDRVEQSLGTSLPAFSRRESVHLENPVAYPQTGKVGRTPWIDSG